MGNTNVYTGPVTAGIELVTPEFAQSALRKNDSNRNMSRSRVQLYKRDMLAGNWLLNGESISFYDNGELKDGQHRLTAIAETGIPQWMVVVRNIPTSTVIADRGKARSTANILEIAGYPASVRQNSVVGAISLLHRIFLGCDQLTDAEIEGFIAKYNQFLMNAWEACLNGSQRPLTKRSPIVAAVFCALYSGVSLETMKDFCKIVNTGFCESDKMYSAIVLRNYLLRSDTSGGRAWRNNCFRTTLLAIEDFASKTPRLKSYNPEKQSKYIPVVKQGVFNLEA